MDSPKLIERLDHLVLTVVDVPRAIEFYVKNLGLTPVEFLGRTALHFGNQKINLHKVNEPLRLKCAKPTPGSADFCFVSEIPVEKFAEQLKANGVKLIEGPVERAGAMGPILSIYFNDTEGNLLEVSNYRIES